MFKPDFNQILQVLNNKKPDRPTLFEFYLNDALYKRLAGVDSDTAIDFKADYNITVPAYANAGYDYTTILGSDFSFPTGEVHTEKSRSLNEGAVIYDEKSFKEYNWQNPKNFDYSRLNNAKEVLPQGMKLIVWGPGGVLENAISLVGYENLCFMLADNPNLAHSIFENVGSSLVTYYEICASYQTVGALISNDDWGFNTQTMLSPTDMRKYVIPWHKKIAEVIHNANKPAILHSCGMLDLLMDDIINDIKYDAKHSFEDNIRSIELSYEKYSDKIALLGGIDLNFLCTKTPKEIYNRSKAMIDKSKAKGGYALGSGNSIPNYVPQENYFAMTDACKNYGEY